MCFHGTSNLASLKGGREELPGRGSWSPASRHVPGPVPKSRCHFTRPRENGRELRSFLQPSDPQPGSQVTGVVLCFFDLRDSPKQHKLIVSFLFGSFLLCLSLIIFGTLWLKGLKCSRTTYEEKTKPYPNQLTLKAHDRVCHGVLNPRSCPDTSQSTAHVEHSTWVI